MQQYGILQALYMSFYSKKLYRDVALNWGGKSFLYLFFLIACSLIYFTYEAQESISIGYHQFYASVGPQIPTLTIKSGIISTPEKRPYIIADPKAQSNFAVIDTTGKYTTLQQANALVLITSTEMITQSGKNETKIYKVPAKLNQTIEPNVINTYFEKYLGFLWILMFAFLWFFFYAYRILQALFYALIGKIFAIIVNVPISYGQIIQIMMVAITPVIVISTLQHISGVSLAYEGRIYFSLAILYLFYGVLANKN